MFKIKNNKMNIGSISNYQVIFSFTARQIEEIEPVKFDHIYKSDWNVIYSLSLIAAS